MLKNLLQPDREWQSFARPTLWTGLKRGFLGKCPNCGAAKLFRGYLRVVAACTACAAPLGNARADDAPPYFTLFIVGHIVIPLMLAVERQSAPSLWLMAAIFLPMTVILTLALLRPIKGATIGLMLTFGLVPNESHG